MCNPEYVDHIRGDRDHHSYVTSVILHMGNLDFILVLAYVAWHAYESHLHVDTSTPELQVCLIYYFHTVYILFVLYHMMF